MKRSVFVILFSLIGLFPKAQMEFNSHMNDKKGLKMELSSAFIASENQQANLRPDSLYKGHDIEYYKRIHRRATVKMGFGAFFSVVGVSSGIVAIVIGREVDDYIAVYVSAAGIVSIHLGFPLLIAGIMKRKNNRKVIEEMEKNMGLTFGPTKNGLGLVFTF
jgi:hypothetical protein